MNKPKILLPQDIVWDDKTQIVFVIIPPEFIDAVIARDGCFCQALLEKIYVN